LVAHNPSKLSLTKERLPAGSRVFNEIKVIKLGALSFRKRAKVAQKDP
jgi:hypothetical protein